MSEGGATPMGPDDSHVRPSERPCEHLVELLHRRIADSCLPLYDNGHWPQAAFEAMKQVEIALKEAGGTEPGLCGVRLADHLLGPGVGVKLRVPLGDDAQKAAHQYFRGTIAYYRNYCAHDGSKIDRIAAARVMVIASDLLELMGASSISFAEIGGLEGLLKRGIFENRKRLVQLLGCLDGQTYPYETFDGLFEWMSKEGFDDRQLQAVFDLGLVEYQSKLVDHESFGQSGDWDLLGWTTLTLQGREVAED